MKERHALTVQGLITLLQGLDPTAVVVTRVGEHTLRVVGAAFIHYYDDERPNYVEFNCWWYYDDYQS